MPRSLATRPPRRALTQRWIPEKRDSVSPQFRASLYQTDSLALPAPRSALAGGTAPEVQVSVLPSQIRRQVGTALGPDSFLRA